MNYKVVEVSGSGKVKELLYKGPSREKAIEAHRKPQSLKFSHKRIYLGPKRIYAYEL